MQLLTEERLLPPARAAFLSMHEDAERPEAELAAAAAAAIRERIKGGAADNDTDTALAFSYAAAVMRQQEVLEGLARVAADPTTRMAALPEPDRHRAEDVLLEAGMRSGTLTIDRQLDAWRRLVHRTEERPHSLTFEEHENWLYSRDILERAVTVIAPDVAAPVVADELAQLDRRFLESTRAAPYALRPPPDPWKPRAWWWYRLPPEPGRQFREYLEQIVEPRERRRVTSP